MDQPSSPPDLVLLCAGGDHLSADAQTQLWDGLDRTAAHYGVALTPDASLRVEKWVHPNAHRGHSTLLKGAAWQYRIFCYKL